MVALARAVRPHEGVGCRFAQHRAGDDRPVEPDRDLGVAADRDDAQLRASGADLFEDLFGQLGRRSFGEERCRQEPGRACAEAGDVIRVDVHDITADLLRRKRDRVGFRHQHAPVAQVDGGGVAADAGAQEQPWIVRKPCEETRQQV